MNRILLFSSLAVVALFALLSAQGPGGDEERGGALGGYMEDIESTLEKISAQLEADEPNFEEALRETCRLQKVAIDAKSEDPRMFSKIEDDKKKLDSMRLQFRTMMQNAVGAMFQLELALLDENAKAAKKAVRELSKVEDKGHGKFRPTGGGR